jgi:hypothetical protein
MPNNINTNKAAPGIIAKLAAGMLEDQLQFCKSIDKADETDFAGKNGYNAGDTIYVSKPARFIPGTSADVTSVIQDVVEEKVALPLDIRYVVPVALTSAEIATDLSLKSWANRVLKPAVSSMAQYIEKAMLNKAINYTSNCVGTAGSTVFDTDTMLSADQKLQEFLAPMSDNKFALLSPAATRSAVNARKGLFQSSEEISKQYKNGTIGQADGFSYLRNNLLKSLTLGVDVSGMAVEASVVAISNGMSTLGVDGVTSGATIKAGSVFTLAGVNAVHPITKADLGYLQQFVVTADVTETSGNSVTLAISPSIYYTNTDPRQNVSAAPVDETSTLTFIGSASTTYTQNLAYASSAFRMASVPLVLPDGLDMAAQETYKGFTVRVVRDYDILTDKLIMRLDFLGGLAPVRPEWACRITA